jgi:exopolysaccharide production protein ExoQ
MMLSEPVDRHARLTSTDAAAWGGNALGQSFWLVVAIVFVVLVTVSGETEYAKLGGEEVYDELTTGSTFTRQIAFLALAGMSAGCLLFLRPPLGKEMYWPLLFPFFSLLALVNLSTLWSDIPSMTIKRAIVISIMVMTGLIMGRIWDARRFALAIVLLSGGFLILSIATEVYYRSFFMADYRFSGIFHPSKQAFTCGLLAIASTTLFFETKQKRFLLLLMIAIGFVILTKSRTGLAATLIATATIGWSQFTWNQRFMAAVAGTIIGIGGFLAISVLKPSYEIEKVALLGRDEESADPRKLTGRLPIWAHAIEEFSERPILGFGYGAFWSKKRLEKYERINGWALTHSHSAYIEALVNVGTIGFITGLGIVLAAYARFWRLKQEASTRLAGRLFFAILTLALLAGLTEIAFIGDGYEAWVLASTLGFACFSGKSGQEGSPGL